MSSSAAVPPMIDVHHHIVPPFYLAEAREPLIAQGSLGPSLQAWRPEAALAGMDRVGIEKAMVSVSAPGIWFGDPGQASSLARRCNEYAAELARRHPGRFGSFAALPLPDPQASLEEIRYALDELGAEGICLMTSYGDRWPGDPLFAPVFDELDRRGAVVFFHPTAPGCCPNVLPDVTPTLVEFPFDTVRAIVSLLFTGAFSRWRNIRFVFSHAGGALPSVAGRIEALAKVRKALVEKVPGGVAGALRRLHYDIALAASRDALDGILRIAPVSQLLMGSDYPFRPIDEVPDGLPKLGLAPEALHAIARGNALALLAR